MSDDQSPAQDDDAETGFNPNILASTLHFGAGLLPRSQRRHLSDDEIEDIVTQRHRGDGW
jgi:hypothetical protein